MAAGTWCVGCGGDDDGSDGNGGSGGSLEVIVPETLTIAQGEMITVPVRVPDADDRNVLVGFDLPRGLRLTNGTFFGSGRDQRLVLSPAAARAGGTVDIASEDRVRPVKDYVVNIEASCGSARGTAKMKLTVTENPEASCPDGWSATETLDVPEAELLKVTRAHLIERKYDIRQTLTDGKETRFYVIDPDGVKLTVVVGNPFGREAWLVVRASGLGPTRKAAKRITGAVAQRMEQRE